MSRTTSGKSENDGGSLLFKVLVVGDYAVGKTSLIRRYAHGYFTPNYKLTIGVDFAIKQIKWDSKTEVSLQLWDIAGHERFGYMTSVYYKYAIAAVIVYDLGRPPTFEAVLKWKTDVDAKVQLGNGRPIPTLLIANKCDIPGVKVDAEKLNEFCAQHGFVGWFATSAQDDVNINEAMGKLVGEILAVAKDHNSGSQGGEDTISIVDSNTFSEGQAEKKCNC